MSDDDDEKRMVIYWNGFAAFFRQRHEVYNQSVPSMVFAGQFSDWSIHRRQPRFWVLANWVACLVLIWERSGRNGLLNSMKTYRWKYMQLFVRTVMKGRGGVGIGTI